MKQDTLPSLTPTLVRAGEGAAMIICLGPCCIPVHLLLAFLVGLLHNRGYMLWFKKEWVTYKHWARRFGLPTFGGKRKAAPQPEAVPLGAAEGGGGKADGIRNGCCDGGGACAKEE